MAGRSRLAASRLQVFVAAPDRSRARAPGLAGWLTGVAPRAARGSVTVALVSDARMRVLNRAYRGADYATDVLSFGGAPRHGREPALLGDIVIATGVARRQAAQAGHAFGTELRILALHGLLHLLGYDHESDVDAGAMARLERRLRQKGGLPTGLIERAAPGRVRRSSRAR